MTVAVGSLVVLVTAWLAWRGYRRGATAALRGWVPRLSAVAGLYLTVWLVWSNTDSLGMAIASGLVAAVILFGAVVFAMRRARRGAEERHRLDGDSTSPLTRPSTVDRIAGVALGVLHAEICCLGLACLASTIVFGVSVREARGHGVGEAAPIPAWAEDLREACLAVSDMSEVGLLRRIPVLKEVGREIPPLIQILNAPPERLALIAEKRDLMRFADVPAVKSAVGDPEYSALIQRARQGELSALSALSESPVTRELFSCPEIREFAKTVTPSQLVADMEEAIAEAPAGVPAGPAAQLDMRPVEVED